MRRPDAARAVDGTKEPLGVPRHPRGFRFVRSRVWLWGTFLAATLAYLIFWGPSEVLLPFLVKNDMHGSASDLGFILALGGVGAMFAAIVMGNREMPRRHITFMYGVWTLSTLASPATVSPRSPGRRCSPASSSTPWRVPGRSSGRRRRAGSCPRGSSGRVSSFDWFISTGLVPVSSPSPGPWPGLFGAQTTLVGAGILGGVVTLGVPVPPGDAGRRTERASSPGPEGRPPDLPSPGRGSSTTSEPRSGSLGSPGAGPLQGLEQADAA